MANVEKRTICRPSEQAVYIDSKVRAGDDAMASEAVERWLQKQVTSSFDAVIADPARAASVENVFATVRARHAEH